MNNNDQCIVFKSDVGFRMPVLELSEDSRNLISTLAMDYNTMNTQRINTQLSPPNINYQQRQGHGPFINAISTQLIPPTINYQQRQGHGRQNLPIFKRRTGIMNKIKSSRVVIIASATGKF